jgi:hypothetical protein
VVKPEQTELLINIALDVDASTTDEREIAPLEWAGAQRPQARKILVVKEEPAPAAPSGIEVAEAWRYLLTQDLRPVTPPGDVPLPPV